MTVILFLAGLVFLVWGAEWLVSGSSALAKRAGIPSLVVGLTVVAFGTSSPELAVSLGAAYAGDADIALGNVVGSNILNVLFILGAAALILPLAVGKQIIRQDVPVMVAVSLLPLVLGYDGALSLVDGIVLFALLVVYTAWLIIQGRRESAAAAAAGEGETVEAPKAGWRGSLWWEAFLVLAGLALLVLGARWLVQSAVAFATWMGVDELVIGLTVVAAGTSLPEVATSLLAAWRGQRDIAVGNVVGSNVFNILGILGVTAMLAPGGLGVNPAVLQLDVPVMFAVAIACLGVCFTGAVIARWEGALFLAGYVLYTAYLVLLAKQHPLLGPVGQAAAWIILPAAGILLAGSALWSARRRNRPATLAT